MAWILPSTLPMPAEGDRKAEIAYLIATGQVSEPKYKGEMDWEAFWALPRPTVSDEAVKEDIEWAKGDSSLERSLLGFERAGSAP